MLRTAARRPGFTLVELMVAAAVCVLIMAVLATAFSLGIDTMRQMKSSGELMDQLRGATTALQADLKADHLFNADGTAVKLSSFRWDQVQVNDAGAMATPRFTVVGWSAPLNGFFRARSSPLSSVAADPDGLVNGTGIATDHYLHFTSKLSGLSDDDYYAATTPQITGKTYQSLAAELAYFLDPTVTGTTPGGTPLFRLVRRQRIIAVNDTDRRDRPWPNAPDDAVISQRKPTASSVFLSTLAEVTNPFNRLGGTQWPPPATNQVGPAYAPSGAPQDDSLAPMASRPGEDTLLSNVISFEVQLVWTVPTDKRLPLVSAPRAFTPGVATETPFDTLPLAPMTGNNIPGLVGTATYDSWSQTFPTQGFQQQFGFPAGTLPWTDSSNINQTTGVVNPRQDVPPLLIRVQAVQVRIRIWDPKLQNARQATIVQEL